MNMKVDFDCHGPGSNPPEYSRYILPGLCGRKLKVNVFNTGFVRVRCLLALKDSEIPAGSKPECAQCLSDACSELIGARPGILETRRLMIDPE